MSTVLTVYTMFITLGTQIINSILRLFNQFILLLPNIIGAVIVLLIGAYIANLLHGLSRHAFQKVKLDAVSEKTGVTKLMRSAGIDVTVGMLLSGIIYWLVLLVFISAASSVLRVQVVTDFINQVISWLPSIFAGLLIMVVGVMVAETLGGILERVRYGAPYKKVVRWLIMSVAFITALEQIGLNLSFLTDNLKLLVAGFALALAIAFGLGGKDKAKEFLDKHF